uniref:GM01586p n=1 Tax=Drosophila melanogaster TaxID=7227 RepID=Q95SE5_DROME|nr:GM01586p [Drosophila melanogaster]
MSHPGTGVTSDLYLYPYLNPNLNLKLARPDVETRIELKIELHPLLPCTLCYKIWLQTPIYLSIYIYSNICIYTRANPHFHVPCGFVSVWVTFPPPYVKCLFIYMKMKTAKQSTDIRLFIPNRPSIDQPPAYLIARPPVHRPKPKPKPILNVRTPARPSIARPPA